MINERREYVTANLELHWSYQYTRLLPVSLGAVAFGQWLLCMIMALLGSPRACVHLSFKARILVQITPELGACPSRTASQLRRPIMWPSAPEERYHISRRT